MRKFLQENFYLLTAAMLASVFISNDAFLPAIPSMALGFGSAESKLQQGVAIFILGSLALQPFVGPLSDRFGRRPVMLGGACLFLLGSIGCITAQNVEFFLLSRLLQGTAMGTTQVTSMAAINEYYPKNKAVSALALSSNITVLAPMLGPIFGAAVLALPIPDAMASLLSADAWRYIFIYTFTLGLFVTVMLALFMPEPSKMPRNLVQVGAGTNQGFPQVEKRSLLHIFRQLPKILKDRSIFFYSLSAAMGGFALLMWITGAPVMLMGQLGLSENAYAWSQAPVFICIFIGNSLAPAFARKLGTMRHLDIMHISAIAVSPIIFLLPFLWPDSVSALVGAFATMGLILGLTNAVRIQLIISLSEYKGSVASVLMLISSSGVFLGSLSASFLGGFANFYSFAVIALASFLLGFFALLPKLFHLHSNKA